MALAWYVAQTEPFKGLVAEEQIKALGFEVFNPKVKTTRTWSRGRVVESISHYLPGYIFSRFDVEVHEWEQINTARGVKSFMWAAPLKPARVDDGDIRHLLGMCVDGYLPGQMARGSVFEVGQVVRLRGGLFQGPIVAIAGSRLAIKMDVFGAKRDVTLDKKDVESIV